MVNLTTIFIHSASAFVSLRCGFPFRTGLPPHRSAHASGFVSRIIASSGLFGSAASPRPRPVCPRLEQEFEAFQAVYWKAMHGRALQREAQLKVENERLQMLLRSRAATLRVTRPRLPGNGSSALGCPTPTHRHDSRAASNAVGPVRPLRLFPPP